MARKWDLSDFEHGMVVGARRAGLSIDLFRFSRSTNRFTKNGPKSKKYTERQFCGAKMPCGCQRSEENAQTGLS